MNSQVDKLVARFKFIDADRMQDLPIYNAALEVEAIDFQPIDIESSGQALIGALITPWFINVILMNIDDAPDAQLGQKVTYQFPSGDQLLMVGEDEELGRYDFLSLASPVLKYKNQQSAQSAARKGLQKILTPADQTEEMKKEQRVQFDSTIPSTEKINTDRRELLRGNLFKPRSL